MNNPPCGCPCSNSPVCCDPPVCNCYNEEDYAVATIEALFCEYCEIEKKADFHFAEAHVKLHEAIEAIKRGLECNKEGYVVWVKIEKWLANYYERFGEYCGCSDMKQQIRECVALLLQCEWEALNHAEEACRLIGESRSQDENMHALRCKFKDCCLPKC